MNVSTPSLDTKAFTGEASSMDVVNAYDDFVQTFEAFKQTNNQRLNEIENRIGEDTITVDKLERINSALDQQKAKLDALTLKQLRPSIEINNHEPNHEAKAAFDQYMRSGSIVRRPYSELKALSGNNEGGVLVPDETENMINQRLAVLSPIRGISAVRSVSSSVYKKPVATSGPAVGWVGETDPRPETAVPGLVELSFPAMELYAMPAASASLLSDSVINLDEWLTAEIEVAFAEQEGKAFVTGDGVNKPLGFLSYPTVDETSWTWGKVGTISTGVSGAFPDTEPADKLIELVYSLKSGYRQNSHFVMSRRTQAEVRKLKDAQGNYLWQPASQPGQQSSLMGFSISEAEDMPDISSGSMSIAFGDFERGYLIVDRLGVNVLRDPFSAKPYVLFYTTKRVGGGIQNFDAIKLLQFS